MIKRLLIILYCMLPMTAMATPLVGDLSNYQINIDSSFNGTRIFLFGARNDNGDIVAVVRGPSKDFIVRKKERIMGVWVNRQRMKFFNVPDFYAIASNKHLNDIEQDILFKQLGIGEDNLLGIPANRTPDSAASEFSGAFLRHQYARKLYKKIPEEIGFMGETLFKSVIEFPDGIPPGDYTAELYLLSDGEISGMQSIPIKVVKSGLDAALYSYAHDHPALYGITAIVLALSIGWFSGRLMERM